MKTEIEKVLIKLLGLPLAIAGRAANLIWFHFGRIAIVKNSIGTEKRVGEFALHVECSWRIARSGEIIVASNDMYVPSTTWDERQEEFNWDVQGMNRCDELMKELIGNRQSPLIVENVQADDVGGVKLLFSEGYQLEIFPDSSTRSEFWRVFIPGDYNSHFVVEGRKSEGGV